MNSNEFFNRGVPETGLIHNDTYWSIYNSLSNGGKSDDKVKTINTILDAASITTYRGILPKLFIKVWIYGSI